jgi:hypothetical protein
MNALRYQLLSPVLRCLRVILFLSLLAAGTELPLNAQSGSENLHVVGSTKPDVVGNQWVDAQNEVNQLNAQIQEKRSELADCARNRQASIADVEKKIAFYQAQIANENQNLARTPNAELNAMIAAASRSRIAQWNEQIAELQRQKISINADFSCDNNINAQIRELNDKLTALRTPRFQPSQPSPQPPTRAYVVPSAPANPTPETKWGFNNKRVPETFPIQPQAATYVDQDGNYVSGPPLQSGGFNNVGGLSTFPQPRRLNISPGEPGWGFGRPDEDPSVVSYDSAGQPIDAEGLVVEYASQEEHDEAVAEMKAADQRAENESKRIWNEMGAEWNAQHKAEQEGRPYTGDWTTSPSSGYSGATTKQSDEDMLQMVRDFGAAVHARGLGGSVPSVLEETYKKVDKLVDKLNEELKADTQNQSQPSDTGTTKDK